MEILRIIRSQWLWFTTNAIGWAVAMASVVTVAIFVWGEFSFDRFHTNANRIYRVTLEYSDGSTFLHPARVVGEWPLELQREYAAIEKVARLVPFRKSVVKINESKFYLNQAFSTDSTFFEVFDVKILSGQSNGNLTQPNRVLVSRSIAEKYFGTIDVVGEVVSILNQQLSESLTYTVEGVYEDFPRNSHFHPDILASLTEINNQTTWAYTYYLMAKDANIDELRADILQSWDAENESDNPTPIVHFQKLTDIHLHSSKTREIEQNSSMRAMLMLIAAAVIILLIALINFLNLCRVKFVVDTKRLTIKMINGAKKLHLVKDYSLEGVILFVVSLALALPMADKLSEQLGVSVFNRDNILIFILLAIVFLVIIVALTVYPLSLTKIKATAQIKVAKSKLLTIPLLLQFTLSILAIACTLILSRQVSYVNAMHPQSSSNSTIIMANNPWEAVQRYEVFKDELLKNPEILSVTGAMEEPGGDILDATPFEMEGISADMAKTINIFTTDSNFFSALGINPLAGTIELGFTPSFQWEQQAMELSMLKQYNSTDRKKIDELEQMVGEYREKYILNQSAIDMLGYSSPNDAIGKRFRLSFHLPYLFPEGEVVGVVPDFHYTNLYRDERPLVIVSRKVFTHCFIVQVNPEQIGKAVSTIERVWRELNPDYPFQYQFITDSYRLVYRNEYSQMKLLAIFTIISIVLSCLGIYAVSAFNMQRKVKEIGIRKVNGAKIWQVMLMLNMDFVKWVAIAFVIATPIAYYAMDKWLQNFAYRTQLSWWVFALAGLLALAIALLTVSWQSWLAARRNPVEALRYE
ncbi:MAG: ABC transporter permease [Bacteroidales bacterium]